MVKDFLIGILCLGNLEEEEELDTEEEKSDQIELYIRWWQLNVFLPMLHFIKPPTTFPENKVSANNLAYFLLLFAGTKFRFFGHFISIFVLPIFHFWFLVTFGSGVTQIQKYYITFV